MKYLNVEYRKFQIQRRFGVEIEMGSTPSKKKVKEIVSYLSDRDVVLTNYKISDENNYWHVKDDATCGPLGRNGPKGVEVASFIGENQKDLDHIADIAEGLYKVGCRVNDNCGLHIHAEVKDLTVDQMGVIMAYWIKLEQVLFLALPFRRFSNPYCKFVCNDVLGESYTYQSCRSLINKEIKWSARDLWIILQPTNINHFENDDRKVNLNIVNYTKAKLYQNDRRKTLELRWPEGTLDATNIQCWVKLFLSFIDTCKNKSMPENLLPATLDEMLTYFGIQHENKKFVILSQELHEMKTWILERIINFGSQNFPLHREIVGAKDILNKMWYPEREYIVSWDRK